MLPLSVFVWTEFIYNLKREIRKSYLLSCVYVVLF